MMFRFPARGLAALTLITALALAAEPAAAASRPLVGTFLLAPGKYKIVRTKSGRLVPVASGTYFRMIYPNGTLRRGPFFANPDSKARDKTYTLLRAGIDGGLITGAFQDPPQPAFAPNGFALANRIVRPTPFTGIQFSLSTAATDAQSGRAVGPPVIRVNGKRLTGDLRGFTASWNNIWFNQGAPKPAGNLPGLTRRPSGLYSSRSRHFVITWVSQIVGGPFNDFAGYWHLQGVFRPRSS
jgi:hypothetical protein